MLPPFAERNPTLKVVIRLSLLILLFFVQIEIIEISLRRYFDSENLQQSIWAPIHGSQRYIFSFLFVFFAAFLVACGSRLKQQYKMLQQCASHHAWGKFLAIQIISYTGFAFLTWQLSTRYPDSGDSSYLLLSAWGLTLFICAAMILLVIAPIRYWNSFFQSEKTSILIAVAVGLATILITSTLITSWPSMVNLTLRFSAFLLSMVYSDVIVIPETATLGLGDFDVQVTAACAGYEGIALITAFLALYLWLFKEDLRFPRVLILFPVGIAAMWVFNGIRIATLVSIGSTYSAEIAVAGFHSNAGWIAFILVSLGLIGAMHRISFFTTRSPAERNEVPESAKMASALLMPMMVLLASTLITSAASSGFDWLYPVKVVLTALTLAFFWRSYAFFRPYFNFEAIAIGMAVFISWILLVPVSIEQTRFFSEEITQAAPMLAVFWLALRTLGSAVTVPLAEELAFRGYILSRLSGEDIDTNRKIAFRWMPFLGSSLLFGIFHGAWLAGTLAGMAYAFARYRRGRVSDAVLAHMTTNALLSAYVLLTREWSYW
jgi:exosortase E/protease (VPEID-CTERM system)